MTADEHLSRTRRFDLDIVDHGQGLLVLLEERCTHQNRSLSSIGLFLQVSSTGHMIDLDANSIWILEETQPLHKIHVGCTLRFATGTTPV